MRIDLIGSGSLGLLFGGRLAAAGNQVTFWCRSMEQAEALQAEGLHITDRSGAEELHIDASQFEAKALAQWQTERKERADWILLMTKQRDVEQVCRTYLSVSTGTALVGTSTEQMICFQNGAGHIEQIRSLLPGFQVYAAVTTEAAKRVSYTHVQHTGCGETWIGETRDALSGQGGYDTISPTSITEKMLIGAFLKAGFKADMSNDIEDKIYRKLMINAVINPLTALWRIPNGELLSTSNRIQLMKQLYEEGMKVYKACGINPEGDLWEQICKVCQSTAANTSSMLSDVLAGTPTEIKWINGHLKSLAERAGLRVPTHELIMQFIEGMRIEEGEHIGSVE